MEAERKGERIPSETEEKIMERLFELLDIMERRECTTVVSEAEGEYSCLEEFLIRRWRERENKRSGNALQPIPEESREEVEEGMKEPRASKNATREGSKSCIIRIPLPTLDTRNLG